MELKNLNSYNITKLSNYKLKIYFNETINDINIIKDNSEIDEILNIIIFETLNRKICLGKENIKYKLSRPNRTSILTINRIIKLSICNYESRNGIANILRCSKSTVWKYQKIFGLVKSL